MKKRRAKKILATLLFFLGYILAALSGVFDRPILVPIPSPGHFFFPGDVGHAFDSQDFLAAGTDLFFYGSIVYGAVSLVFWTRRKDLEPEWKEFTEPSVI
jgi:hypothetical protein